MYNSAQYDDSGPELSWEEVEPALLREYDEFPRYFDRWVKYYPKKPYNVKWDYRKGFVQKLSTRGNPKALHGDYLISCVERHLDNRYWAEQQIDEKRRQHQERLVAEGMDERSARSKAWGVYGDEYDAIVDRPYWLGLWLPRKTTDHCIDFDAKKHTVGLYEYRRIVEPVVCPNLEHFQTLKRIYDHFPGRIWCISSRTLGIHAWKKHGLRVTLDLHAYLKRRLEAIGLGSVEVHPMPGRCFRRPFGRDYLVVTPEKTLTQWTDQVRYYEDDGRTAPFDRVVQAMLDRIDNSLNRYYGRTSKSLQRLSHPLITRRLDDVRRWCDNGFKERHSVPGCSSPPTAAAEPIAPVGGDRVDLGKVSLSDSTVPPPERDGSWPLWLERMAITGLVADDTVGQVVHEMAKWLYWVELFHLPAVDRVVRIEKLLEHYALTKHNGFITRLGTGNERDVLAQVRAAVTSASRIDRPESLELFARLRDSRNQGKYERPIYLEPRMDGCTQGDDRSSSSLFLTTYMFINKELSQAEDQETGNKDIPDLPAPQGSLDGEEDSSVSSSLTTSFINKDSSLPPVLESEVEKIARDHRMRKRGEGYPLVRFARRLLHTLWESEGTARLSSEVLVKMVGTSNPNQEVTYRRLLQKSRLIHEGTGETDHLVLTWELLHGDLSDTTDDMPRRQKSGYQPHAFSKTYRLSERSMREFGDYYAQVAVNATAEPPGTLEPNR